MNYELFKDFESFEDEASRTCGCFKIDDNFFIVEPNFYTQLLGMKVIFTADYEFPACYKNDFIYREITDITDPLLIFVEDKSRGSDYGD